MKCNSINYITLSITVLFLGCTACNRSTKYPVEQQIEYNGGIIPEQLSIYFDSLQRKGFGIPYHSDSTEKTIVENCIAQLQRYKNGERKYYPAEDIYRSLEIMRLELGYIYNHCGDADGDFEIRDYVFFIRFLEQAALLCPQLELLTNIMSADRKIGVINFQEWSPNPLFSFVLNENPQGGFFLTRINDIGSVKIEKIFTLDNEGKKYYLLSNNNNLQQFSQYICIIENHKTFLFNGKNFTEAFNKWTASLPENYTIVFNPQKVCWNLCKFKNNVFQPIEKTQTLYLKLDGEKSYYYVE